MKLFSSGALILDGKGLPPGVDGELEFVELEVGGLAAGGVLAAAVGVGGLPQRLITGGPASIGAVCKAGVPESDGLLFSMLGAATRAGADDGCETDDTGEVDCACTAGAAVLLANADAVAAKIG